MYKYAQILAGLVHWVTEDDLDQVALYEQKYCRDHVTFIDITAADPAPEVGWTYDEATGSFAAPPPLPLADAQDLAIANLAKAAAAAYTGGFYSTASGEKSWYDSDVDTQKIISDLYTDAVTGIFATTVYWPGQPAGVAPITSRPLPTDPDGAKITNWLNKDQIIAWRGDYKAAWQEVKAIMWSKKARVYAATTAEAALAITWTAP